MTVTTNSKNNCNNLTVTAVVSKCLHASDQDQNIAIQ